MAQLIPLHMPSPAPTREQVHPAGTMTVLREAQQPEAKEPKMEPGRTYVTVLPGRKRPAFVRKRVELPSPVDLGLTVLRKALGPSQRQSHSADRAQYGVRVFSAPEPQYHMAPPPQQHLQLQLPSAPQQTSVTEKAITRYPGQPLLTQPLVEAPDHVSETISTKVVTRNDDNNGATSRHTCGSCGKYRSINYQSRHPLAPGEVSQLSFCTRCIKEYTSSEDDHDEGRLRRRSHHREKYHKKRRHGKRRRVRTDSTEENQRSSSSREDIHVVRRSRRISRSPRRSYRSRSSSSSRFSPSYRPVGLLKGRPRSSDERIKVIERTRYVDHLARPLPRSRSREAISRQSSRYERLLDQQSSEHDRARTYPSPELRRPLSPYRAIEYSYDDDHHEEHTIRPVPRRRSRSVLARHVMPCGLQREEYVRSIPEPYPEHVIRDDRFGGRSYGYDPNFDEAPHPPSRSVRVIRVTEDSDDQLRRHEWDRGRPETTNTGVPFPGKASYQRPRSQEIIVESVNSTERPRRRRYEGGDESSDDSSSDEVYPSERRSLPRGYRGVRLPPGLLPLQAPPSPGSHPEHYYAVPARDAPHEITHTLQPTYKSPPRSSIPVYGRAEGYEEHFQPRSRSYRPLSYHPPPYRRSTGGGEHGPVRVIEVDDDAGFYTGV